jgi:phosphocarrier protein HPr
VETRSIFFIPRKKVISRTHIIQNKFGLHARPSASFVQTAMRYRSEIKVEKDGQVADGKSIMDLMMLAAAQGTYITINAQGEDALDALEALGMLIEGRFGEE